MEYRTDEKNANSLVRCSAVCFVSSFVLALLRLVLCCVLVLLNCVVLCYLCCRIWSRLCLVLSCRVLYYLVLSYIWSCLISGLVLYLVLSYHDLYCHVKSRVFVLSVLEQDNSYRLRIIYSLRITAYYIHRCRIVQILK